jgi:hypothetical protein
MVKNATILLAGLGLVAVSMTSARASSNQGKLLCYLWADQASPALNTPYTPDPTYSFSAKHKDISVTKVATGVYSVQCVGAGGGSRGQAGMFRSRPMGPAATSPATSGSGIRSVPISSPRSIALARAAGQAEALHPQTVNSFCCSSDSAAAADGQRKSRRRRSGAIFLSYVSTVLATRSPIHRTLDTILFTISGRPATLDGQAAR